MTPRHPRLLLAVDSLDTGGAERHVVDLAAALAREGYGVAVACSRGGALSGPLREAGVPAHPLLGRLVKRRASPAFARGIRALLRNGERFDLVHAHVYASMIASAAAVAQTGFAGTGVPLVVTEHTEATWQGAKERLARRSAYRRAAHVVAVSSRIRNRLVEEDGVLPEKTTVVPNAVVAPGAGPDPRGAPEGIPEGWRGAPLVGVVARLQPEKGVAGFLKAAARVRSFAPRARFVVVGDGPLREELEVLADRLGVARNVRFLGYRSDARSIMAGLDVLVVPSSTEGSPLVVLEGMAAGLPIVASDVGGIPDQVRDGREGFLVPPNDPARLGDAILALLRDPHRARALGEAARRRAASEFSHAAMVRRIEAVYRTALGAPAATAVGEPGGLEAGS